MATKYHLSAIERVSCEPLYDNIPLEFTPCYYGLAAELTWRGHTPSRGYLPTTWKNVEETRREQMSIEQKGPTASPHPHRAKVSVGPTQRLRWCFTRLSPLCFRRRHEIHASVGRRSWRFLGGVSPHSVRTTQHMNRTRGAHQVLVLERHHTCIIRVLPCLQAEFVRLFTSGVREKENGTEDKPRRACSPLCVLWEVFARKSTPVAVSLMLDAILRRRVWDFFGVHPSAPLPSKNVYEHNITGV